MLLGNRTRYISGLHGCASGIYLEELVGYERRKSYAGLHQKYNLNQSLIRWKNNLQYPVAGKRSRKSIQARWHSLHGKSPSSRLRYTSSEKRRFHSGRYGGRRPIVESSPGTRLDLRVLLPAGVRRHRLQCGCLQVFCGLIPVWTRTKITAPWQQNAAYD